MQFEVEQKYWVGQFEELRNQLESMGIVLAPAIEQIDHYFSHSSRDYLQTDEALRLRQVGEANFITYKGARLDSTTKTREELELPLAEGNDVCAEFTKLLTLLGFHQVMMVRKSRQKAIFEWQGRELEICLDEIDQLGSFVEIEATSDAQHLDEAKQVVEDLATQLGLDRHERRSYLELLLHQLAPHK